MIKIVALLVLLVPGATYAQEATKIGSWFLVVGDQFVGIRALSTEGPNEGINVLCYAKQGNEGCEVFLTEEDKNPCEIGLQVPILASNTKFSYHTILTCSGARDGTNTFAFREDDAELLGKALASEYEFSFVLSVGVKYRVLRYNITGFSKAWETVRAIQEKQLKKLPKQDPKRKIEEL